MGIIAPIFTNKAVCDRRTNKIDRVSSKVSLAKIIDGRLKLNNSV
jgi:hypothetical protein